MGLAPVELAGRYRKTGDVRAVCHHKFYLDNQPVPFQRHGVSDSGSLLAGLHFLYGGFHWEKYADPCRRYHRRLVLGGILYRVSADSHSGGGDLRCLHRAYQTGNHKSHPCRCQFRGGVRAVRCLYRLCS